MKILLSLLVLFVGFVACNGKAPLPTEPAAKTSDCSHITDLFERFACEATQEETEDTEESPSSDSSESAADTTALITKLSFRASELDFGQTEDALKWGIKNLSTLDTIRFSLISSASWLTTNPSVGVLPPGQFEDIYVSVDRTQNQVGNQEETLTVQVEKRIKNIKVFVQFPNPEPVFFAYGAFPVVAPDGRVLYVRMEDRGDLNIRIVHADRTG